MPGPRLSVHLLPMLAAPETFEDAVVAPIDVLRATTTICQALAAGARAVVPCVEVEQAQAFAATLPREEVLLGGEREGLRIEGFDLGNSPSEYSAAAVASTTIAFTTTNGTRAIERCRQARAVLLGAFVNFSALVRRLRTELQVDGRVHLLCAGTRGEITGEDALLAGAVANALEVGERLNDQAWLARAAWREFAGGSIPDPRRLGEHLLATTQGGRNLAALGLANDVFDAARIDRFDLLAEAHRQADGAWRIEGSPVGQSLRD